MGLFDNIKDYFNKAEFTVAPNKKLKSISRDFNKSFDLSLIFYKGNQIADENLTLKGLDKKTSKDIDTRKYEGLKIKGSMKVGDAEKFFEDHFGVKVQVKDKSGKNLVPNGITLGQAARGEYNISSNNNGDRDKVMVDIFKYLEENITKIISEPFTKTKFPDLDSNFNKKNAIYFYGDKTKSWLSKFNILVTPKENKIVFSSQRSNLISSGSTNILESKDIMQKINDTDDALNKICKEFGFDYTPFAPRVKFNVNQNQFRATYKLKKTYNNESELFNNEEMERLSEFIVKFSVTKFEMMNKYFDEAYKVYL